MKQAVLSHFDLTWLPVSGLVLFVALFALHAYWTYRRENRVRYLSAAALPLTDAPAIRKNPGAEHE